MGSSVCLRPDQRLEEEQHQCEELWTDDSQLQSSFPLPPLSGERSKAPLFFLMTMCRNVRNTAVKENKDYTATTSLRLKSCPTMAKPMVTHHASHPCANPVSVRSRKTKKQNRWRLTGCGCSHQTQWNSLPALTHWLAAKDPIRFPKREPQPVFGHACIGCGCATASWENLRVQRECVWSQAQIEDLLVGTAICQSCDTTALSISVKKINWRNDVTVGKEHTVQ